MRWVPTCEQPTCADRKVEGFLQVLHKLLCVANGNDALPIGTLWYVGLELGFYVQCKHVFLEITVEHLRMAHVNYFVVRSRLLRVVHHDAHHLAVMVQKYPNPC